MIVDNGQFGLRLDQISSVFALDDDLLASVEAIEFTQHPAIHMDMAYSVTLRRDGKDGMDEPLRFVRRRTAIRLLNADGEAVWTKGTKGEHEPE